MTSFPENIFACWHPIAYSHEVTDKPVSSKLLDEHLVIWRTADGKSHVMQDLCIHRGTALSLGWTTGEEIVCAYHGWRYGESGKCTVIPQKVSPTIPTKARVKTYQSLERYGLIWANLRDEPRYDLPEVPEFESSDWKLVNTGPFDWNSDSSRQTENFTDFGHFPWVHPGLLGDVNRPIVDDYTVTVKDHVLHYSVVRPEAANTDDFPIFANEEVVKPERRSRYELHCPYTIVLRLGWGGEKGMVYFFVSQP
ncbi:MAG: Rieske 2Fe-2S domain-containing protein, partial [Aggregatilineales bacterium]